MSEQVSLDFLISLKQATQNVQQTRKIGGALDYLANLAKKANDALFFTSSGEDAAEKYDKSSRQKQKQSHTSAGLMAAAAKVTKNALDLTIMGVRASIGWWADHAGKMILFRKEMGFAADEVHKFSLGVLRSSAQYGTSMRTVRDLTFFMVRGAKTATKEVEKMAGALATLVDFGGVDTSTITNLMTLFAGANELMTKEGVTQFISSFKVLAQEAKVPIDDVLSAFGSMNRLIPSLGQSSREFVSMYLVETAKLLESPMKAAEILNSVGEESSRMNALFLSSGANMETFMTRIAGQLKAIREKGKDASKEETDLLQALRVRTTEQAGQQFGLTEIQSINTWIKATENAVKGIKEGHKIFNMTAAESRQRWMENLTPLEEIHRKIQQIKATASGFWESFIGGKGGDLLTAALHKIEAALQYWERVWGDPNKAKDESERASKILTQSHFSALNPLSFKSPVARYRAWKKTPEWAAREARKDVPGATPVRRAANDALSQLEMTEYRGEANRHREKLQTVRTEDGIQKILKVLLELLNATGEGNTERVNQGKKKDERVREPSVAGAVAKGKLG